MDIDTPFLRPAPELADDNEAGAEQKSSLSAAAAVLANRVRRRNRGLTEDWIRAHTAGDSNAEPKHWFSEGSDSEHSSLSGSDLAWLDERDPRTPRAVNAIKAAASRRQSRHPRARSSLETLKPGKLTTLKTGNQVSMSTTEAESTASVVPNDVAAEEVSRDVVAQTAASSEAIANDVTTESPAETPAAFITQSSSSPKEPAEIPVPTTPPRKSQKPLPKEPLMTPRIKKKVPWKGKNIQILVPRDDQRGLPGKAHMPLRAADMKRMFESWRELGYSTDGFDLFVEGYQPPGTDDSQSRDTWPSPDDMARERAGGKYKVTLPDLNAWKDYVNELQEAKLRALGVSMADDEPAPSVSPSITDASRQASAQYPPLPFSPPLPTSSASSNHLASFQFPGQFYPGGISATQSPSIASPVPFGQVAGKYNPRQSISLPTSNSPFQLGQNPNWQHQAAGLLQGLNRVDSPNLINLNGLISPQSPYGLDGFQQSGSPALNAHQRRQSLQYMPPHQMGMVTPQLEEVREEEDAELSKSPSKTPEPTKQQQQKKNKKKGSLQAEMQDAEYHLEEQLRNQLEHEDYNPQADSTNHETLANAHERQASGNLAVSEHFANDPTKPVKLHHPRPHSRGQSLTQNLFREYDAQGNPVDSNTPRFDRLNQIPESGKGDADEAYEIETNPSNLGTPVQDFDFAAVLAPPQRVTSTGSNPWTENGSGASNGRRSGQANKAPLSKLNVKAPEFKFNPTSNFTPGLYSFTGGQSFEPAPVPVFQTAVQNTGFDHSYHNSIEHTVNGSMDNTFDNSFNNSFGNNFDNTFDNTFDSTHDNAHDNALDNSLDNSHQDSIPQFGGNFASNFNAGASSFNPGKSEFSFSTSGPKFRPDAPSFTPFQSLNSSITSQPSTTVKFHPRRTDSIFGNIQIDTSEIVKPVKKSKAIPIVRPSSTASDKSGKSGNDVSFAEDLEVDADGRVTNDARAKRAKSIAPTSEEMPLFASITEESTRGDDASADVDTSMSSINASEQVGTKETTAVSSPSGTNHRSIFWKSLERQMTTPVLSRNNSIDHAHRRSLSGAAATFTPGAGSHSGNTPTGTPTRTANHTPAASIKAIIPEEITEAPTQKSSGTPTSTSTPQLSPKPAKSKPKGLAASRFAFAAAPAPAPEPTPAVADPISQPEPLVAPAQEEKEEVLKSVEEPDLMEFASEPAPEPAPAAAEAVKEVESVAAPSAPAAPEPVKEEEPASATSEQNEPTFEEIDAVMQQLESNPTMGVKKSIESSIWAKAPAVAPVVKAPSPVVAPVVEAQPVEAPHDEPAETQDRSVRDQSQPLPTTELDDPFVDPPVRQHTPGMLNEFEMPRVGSEARSEALSDWENTFSEDEHSKLENRTQFFDGRVNEIVGNLLASKFEPLEQTLLSIQHSLGSKSRRAPSSRRDIRSLSGEIQESDADDEDDEPVPQRSASPRKDRRIEQIRSAVLDAMSTQQQNQVVARGETGHSVHDESSLLQALEEMKEQLMITMKSSILATGGADGTQRALPGADDELVKKMEELQGKVSDLDHRLYFEQTKLEKEVADRRAAEDNSAELSRQLQAAETRVEVEILNRSVHVQRVTDLEERLRLSEEKNEAEAQLRRAAEDRVAEVERLLKFSTEEETRLRGVIEDKESKMRDVEQQSGKKAMRMSLLEAAQTNATKSTAELTNKVNALEGDLREVRQDNTHWRSEAERADETARRTQGELGHALDENKRMQKTLDTLTTQLEENERLRESWRNKFGSLQEDMAQASREVAEESARRIKKEQAMLARQEVLDARLQAEAKTRERLEVEMERLQNNERSGMRAVNECTRLEGLIGELRTENYRLQQTATRHQLEFEEARESGASEVKRTRMALQTELDAANNQVNVVRQELEDQIRKLRTELDNVRFEADTAKDQHELLVEESHSKKKSEIEELQQKHQNYIEDLQTRHEREINNATEDASRSEQNLLERLSISSAKIEHLQERNVLLEEKLEIAKEAAAAAAQAAKAAGVDPNTVVSPTALAKSVALPAPAPVQAAKLELPEKISPQALRESIMVLQEQLQAREQRIEELEATVAKSDPDAASKISKRDDEISWLRELLAVRHGDLQDIISALSKDNIDRERVKDAAIRLKANLQMEEQERERAMNGGSAISLPNIAQSLQAATPRVAQTIGSGLNAWDRWRKSSQPSFLSGVLSSPTGGVNATPSRSNSSSFNQSSLLNGLMTPPASGLRQTPPADNRPQPTAFASTGRRFPSRSSVQNRSLSESTSSAPPAADKLPARQETPPQPEEEQEGPVTPPMARDSAYDSDAQPGDFDDHDFFED